MSSRVLRLPLCAAFLTLALVGCASQRLSSTAPPGVRLSGNWALDPAASSDIGRAVASLRAQIDKAIYLARRARRGRAVEDDLPQRRETPRGESDEASGGERGQASAAAQSGGPPPPDAGLVQEFLTHVPGSHLQITLAPGSFSVVSENASQQYSTGVRTAVELDGVSAEQRSGWQGRKYVIDTRPEWGPAITQSYGLAPDGSLVATVLLSGQGIDTAVTLHYRRTQEAPAALLPNSD